MTAPILQGDARADQFFALPSLEQQAMYLLVYVAAQENAYNTANPNNLQNRATLAVNYDTRNVVGQLNLGLVDNAAEGRLANGCVPYLP